MTCWLNLNVEVLLRLVFMRVHGEVNIRIICNSFKDILDILRSRDHCKASRIRHRPIPHHLCETPEDLGTPVI